MRIEQNGFGCLLFCSILVQAFPAHATPPAINNVSGTVASGQLLTIAGANMMELNTSQWLTSQTQSNFEGASSFVQNEANGDDWYWFGGCNASYDQNIRLIGNHSAYLLNNCCNIAPGPGACGNVINDSDYLSNGRRELYMAGYFRYSGSSWPTNYMKFILLEAGAAYPNKGNLYFQPEELSEAGISTFLLRDNTGVDISASLRSPYLLRKNTWHHFEVRWKTSAPARHEAWIDGVPIGSITPAHNENFNWDIVGFPNLAGFYAPEWVGLHLDMLVYSAGRVYPAAVVEIGNRPVYSEATRVSQPLERIGDTSITLQCDISGLGPGPYYLWVTNNLQERSGGYGLSSGEPARPSPPKELRIMR